MECELAGSGGQIDLGFFSKAADKISCARKRLIEVVDAEEEQQAISGHRPLWTRERGVVVRASFVQAQQDRSVHLPKLGVGRRCPGLAEQRLVPVAAARNVSYDNDCPR